MLICIHWPTLPWAELLTSSAAATTPLNNKFTPTKHFERKEAKLFQFDLKYHDKIFQKITHQIEKKSEQMGQSHFDR